ncbi:hypothetical protein ACFLR3_00835 [Campylobacterota bacterium]
MKKYTNLLAKIKQDFKIDFYGDHGIGHWQRVYDNTQKLANHYNVQSNVFELFAILHDSQRENEFVDIEHGLRASLYTIELIENDIIELDETDRNRLLYACANHTRTDVNDPLFNDLIVQICFDSDRLDIGRVGIQPDAAYMATEYAKSLIVNNVTTTF